MKKIHLFLFLSLLDTTLFAQTILDLRFAQAVRQQCPTCLNDRNQLQEPAKKLSRLDLNFKQITDLTGIEGFLGLVTLDCSNNRLTKLPFMPNTYLRQLRCANNRLTSLPFFPESLLYLDCSGNKIDFVVGLPRAMRELNINGNALKELPTLPANMLQLECVANKIESISSLPDDIQLLNISYNQLRKLPKLPAGLTKLVADNNQLDSLPTLPYQLKECSAVGNKLKKAPILPELLQVLNFNNNLLDSLTSLPPRLVSLSFANNKVALIYGLPPALKEMDCRNNLLVELPRLPRRLVSLKLKGNSVPCLGNMPEKLTKIDDETMSECIHPHFGLIEQAAPTNGGEKKQLFQAELLTATESQLVPYRKGNKWGFANTRGEIRVMPRFDGATLFEKNPNFSYSFSVITLDGRKGIIDIEGEYVISPDYADVRALTSGGFIAKRMDGNNWIYITEDAIVEEKFPQAITNDPIFKRFAEGKSIVAPKMTELVATELFLPLITRSNDNTEMGYTLRKKTLVDKYSGTYVTNLVDSIPPQYSEIKYLSPISFDTLLAKSKDGKWGIITTKNEVLVSFNYEEIKPEILTVKDQYDAKIPYFTGKKNGKWGVSSVTDSTLVLDYDFDEVKIHWIQPYNIMNRDSNRLFLKIRKGNKWGLMAEKLWVTVVPTEYDSIELDKETANGFQLVKGNQMGYFIIGAEKTIPTRYKEVRYFKNGFAEVLTDRNLIGFVNENGDEYFLD